MKKMSIAILLAAAVFSGTVMASVVSDFLELDNGYSSMDPLALESAAEAQLPQSGSVFLSSSQLSPLAKAVLVAEVHDGPLWLYRYQLQLTLEYVDAPPAADPLPTLRVDLRRYNLGPVQHASLVEELGADMVAPADEFGVGSHTAWRLVLSPVMGQPAAIMEASRRELSEEEAALASCFGAPCLQLQPLNETSASWQAHQLVPATEAGSILPVPHPAAMLDLVSQISSFDPYQSELSGQVIAEVLIETAGAQDDFIDVVLRQGPLADDSLLAVWHRVYAFPAGEEWPEVHATEAYECQRGTDAFAAVGGFCL